MQRSKPAAVKVPRDIKTDFILRYFSAMEVSELNLWPGPMEDKR